MSIKEMTIRELDSLEPEDLLRIHEWIMLLKRQSNQPRQAGKIHACEEVQRLLASCPGSLSEDVSRDREDRG